LGAYYKKYESDLERYVTDYDLFSSDYTAYSSAIYGQLDISLNEKLSMVTGLRVEKWKTKYSDNNTHFSDSENLVGAKLGLQYQKSESQLFYATLSRGYKPGGFNPVTTESGLPKQYQTESLWNLDLGMNSAWLDNKLKNRVNFFYGKRKDQQVPTYYVTPDFRYTDYITNADKGTYYGLETELDYYPTDSLSLNASLGLLRAKFDTYYSPVDDVSKDGRAPAYSPEYQYNIGMNYMLTENWNLKTNVEGKGSYYFENIKDAKSDAYTIVNASVEYTTGNWSATLWGRNLTDENYQTIGYLIDNGFPGDEQLYFLQGDPRTFGFTLAYDF
jgi:outer membrane receptor protein involved in Fe transport